MNEICQSRLVHFHPSASIDFLFSIPIFGTDSDRLRCPAGGPQFMMIMTCRPEGMLESCKKTYSENLRNTFLWTCHNLHNVEFSESSFTSKSNCQQFSVETESFRGWYLCHTKTSRKSTPDLPGGPSGRDHLGANGVSSDFFGTTPQRAPCLLSTHTLHAASPTEGQKKQKTIMLNVF